MVQTTLICNVLQMSTFYSSLISKLSLWIQCFIIINETEIMSDNGKVYVGSSARPRRVDQDKMAIKCPFTVWRNKKPNHLPMFCIISLISRWQELILTKAQRFVFQKSKSWTIHHFSNCTETFEKITNILLEIIQDTSITCSL